MATQAQKAPRKNTRAANRKAAVAANMAATPEQQADAIVAEQQQQPAAWNWPVGAAFGNANGQAQTEVDEQEEVQQLRDEQAAREEQAGEEVDPQKAGDALADKIAAAQAAPGKAAKLYIPKSSIIRPTKVAWTIYDHMFATAEEQGLPAPTRKECIAEAIAAGIATGTAATQFQYWKKASGR